MVDRSANCRFNLSRPRTRLAPDPPQLRGHHAGEARRVKSPDDRERHAQPDARWVDGHVLLIHEGRGEFGFEAVQRLEVIESVEMLVDQFEQTGGLFEWALWFDPGERRCAESRQPGAFGREAFERFDNQQLTHAALGAGPPYQVFQVPAVARVDRRTDEHAFQLSVGPAGEEVPFILGEVKWIKLQQPAERVHLTGIDPGLADLFDLGARPRVEALRRVVRLDAHAGPGRLIDAGPHFLRAVAGWAPFGEFEVPGFADLEQRHAAGARDRRVFASDREHQTIELLSPAEVEKAACDFEQVPARGELSGGHYGHSPDAAIDDDGLRVE